MGVVLRSKAVWTVMGVLFAMSVSRMVMRQLAKDPRFLALPQRVSIEPPAWGGEALAAPSRTSLECRNNGCTGISSIFPGTTSGAGRPVPRERQ